MSDIVRQDAETTIPELAGAVCERLLCVQFKDVDGRVVPCVFWLKIQGGRWHRFFIDAWVLHWQEQDTVDDWGEAPTFPLLDVGARDRISGGTITEVTMRQTPDNTEFDCCLTISFADRRKLLVEHSEDASRMSVLEHATN